MCGYAFDWFVKVFLKNLFLYENYKCLCYFPLGKAVKYFSELLTLYDCFKFAKLNGMKLTAITVIFK